MTPAEMFRLLQSGTPLNNDQLDDRGDLEDLIKGVLANLAPGGQNPAAFEDVEVGRTTVELPSRPRFDRYDRAESGTDEWRVAQAVRSGMSPSQYEAKYRTDYMERFPDLDEDGLKQLDEAAKRARSDAEDLWEESDIYERAVNQLSPEGQQALAEGRSSYDEVEYGPSKARKYFTDQGLSAPTDVFQDSDFGVDQVADALKQKTAREKWESFAPRDDFEPTKTDGIRNMIEGAFANITSGGRNQREVDGADAFGAILRNATNSQRGQQEVNRATRARTQQRHAAGGEMFKANVSKEANKVRAEGLAAVMAKHGRTPFTEQIRAKLGQ